MWRISLLSVVAAVLLLGGITQAARDVTAPGDVILPVPNDGDWPGNERVPQAIDNQVVTKYLHFKGETQPTGFQVTLSAGAIVVTGINLCSANDAEDRDPVKYELSGSNVSIDGPYTLIAKGDVKDFAGSAVWPRRTWLKTPIKFANTVSYKHYQLMFSAIRMSITGASTDSMQIAEVELLADVFTATTPDPANGKTGVTMAFLQWKAGDTAKFHDVYLGTDPAALTKVVNPMPTYAMYMYQGTLEPGVTYYWRVDERDVAGTVYTGEVWSFTVQPLTANSPTPLDGDKWIDPAVELTWLPGQQNAATHVVYFDTDKAKVVARDPSVLKATQPAMSFNPGLLAQDTTYYWAVDEVVSTGNVLGEVWSFTTIGPNPGGIKGEYFSNTSLNGLPALTRIDPAVNFNLVGVGPGDPIPVDGWSARWTADLDVTRADTYMFAVNCQDGTKLWIDGKLLVDQWVTPTVTSKYFSLPIYLDKGVHSLVLEYFDSGGDAVEQLYWSTATMAEVIVPAGPLQPPVRARAIYPQDKDVNTPQDVVLTWSVGEKTATHDVYFGEDKAAVEAATPADAAVYKGSQTKDENSWTASGLDWNKTYYWRVDEVNTADEGSPWKSSVWSFTTADFIVVDDFESYTNSSPYRVFQTWIDGWGFSADEFFAADNPGNSSSSTVGHDIWTAGTSYSAIVETSIINPGSGGQSMPFDYNNATNPYFSETDRTWSSAQNWKVNGVTDLVLYFRGNPARFLETATGISMSAAGADIYGATDEFRFAWKRLSGDGSIAIRVDSVQTVNSWTKAGVMIRESLDPLAMQVHMVTGAQQQVVEWMYRAITNDTVVTNFNTTGGTNPLPAWVRITRAGNVFTGEYSKDGTTWTKITQADGTASSFTLTMPATVYIGMVVSSHVTNVVASAQFSDIKTTGNVTGAWQATDVGVVHPGNEAAQLYVALQDSSNKLAVVNYPSLEAVLTTTWTQWKIPLSQFTGVNVGAIKKMYIGVGNRTAGAMDGHGSLYIDDIRVMKP